jgi:hypothetical protein
MKKIAIFLFSLVLFCSGCSSNDSTTLEEITNEQYFRLNVGGVELPLSPDANFNRGAIDMTGDVFLIHAEYGYDSSSPQLHLLKIYFDKSGAIIEAKQQSYSVDFFGSYDYLNYENFPSNYFHINIISLDEVNKKIKLNFTGKLYLNNTDMNSEAITISAELNQNYGIIETPYGIRVNDIEQYCSAKFNNVPWIARKEKYYSEFTAPDAYKIETHFTSNATPGSYDFTPSSTDNYIRFSKFNIGTLTYDYYNVTGVIAHSYREFHGLTNYSFIGSFSFTAVNPNNPSDVIQVTDGIFRSYQQY